MALDTWKWKPKGTSKPTNTPRNTRVEFINGNEQIQRNSVNNKLVYEQTFENTLDGIEDMRTFFNNHAHGETFYFTNEFGEKLTVRFAEDSFAPEIKWGFVDGSNEITAVGGSVTLKFRRVV